MLRGRTRRDGNEALILETFRKAGWSVLKINEPGAPDAVVFGRGSILSGWRVHLVEVKQPNGKLRERQQRFQQAWTGPEVKVVRTVEDVLEMVR